MNPAIFINYRRDDAGAEAALIREALRGEFGNDYVFFDVSSLEPGAKWPEEIQSALKTSRTVLAVIGPDWLRAAIDEWGRRRIDHDSDWVRQELQLALSEGKVVIPVLVRGGRIPPKQVLPQALHELANRQAIEIRRDYWEHDIKLLLAKLAFEDKETDTSHDGIGPYPKCFPVGPDAISEEMLEQILASELTCWSKVISPLPEDPTIIRTELYREFKFRSFAEAVRFMNQVAPGCDIALHHPRWENIWKTVRVYLSTWDIEHKVSDRDIQLARYFDWAYKDFPGAEKRERNQRK